MCRNPKLRSPHSPGFSQALICTVYGSKVPCVAGRTGGRRSGRQTRPGWGINITAGLPPADVGCWGAAPSKSGVESTDRREAVTPEGSRAPRSRRRHRRWRRRLALPGRAQVSGQQRLKPWTLEGGFLNPGPFLICSLCPLS